MKRPFCVVDGVRYQLTFDKHGILRFPNDGRTMPDLNEMAMQYAYGQIKLKELWDYHSNSGSSYELVWGLFSLRGWNNHIVKNGSEPTKRFVLYLEKSAPNENDII